MRLGLKTERKNNRKAQIKLGLKLLNQEQRLTNYRRSLAPEPWLDVGRARRQEKVEPQGSNNDNEVEEFSGGL